MGRGSRMIEYSGGFNLWAGNSEGLGTIMDLIRGPRLGKD